MYITFAFGCSEQIFAIGSNVRCLHQLLVFASSLCPQTEVLSPYSV